MGDGKGGAIRDEALQGLLDLVLGLGVHRTGGFVQDEDARIADQGPGDRNALALAAREPAAALAHFSVVPVREVHDKPVRIGRARHRDDLLAGGFRPAVRDVLGDAAMEEQRLLQHDADLRPQLLLQGLLEGDAVDENLAVRSVVEPRDQVDQSGLARAAGPHDADHLARLHLEADLVEDAREPVVGKADIAELHRPLQFPRVDRVLIVDHVRLGVQDLEDPLGRGGRALQLLGDHAQLAHRLVEHHHVRDKGLQLAQGDGAAQHPATAEPPENDGAHRGDEGNGRQKVGAQLDRFHPGLAQIRIFLVKAGDLAVLLRKSLDHLDPGNGIGQHGV